MTHDGELAISPSLTSRQIHGLENGLSVMSQRAGLMVIIYGRNEIENMLDKFLK